MRPVPEPVVTRHLRRCGDVHLHYRQAGTPGAPALVLLHPTPRSSAMFEPWMVALAPHFHLLAIDTPGFGGSQALPGPPQSLHDCLAPMHELMLAVAGPEFMLYGSATGAQLGIAYATAHPAPVRHLLLDNAAHFDADEREAILARYFPDLAPRADGSHLLRGWQMAAQMQQFFPWFAADAEHCFNAAVPSAEQVHAALLEFLAAGADCTAVYRLAFAHERAERVMALRVPTTVLRWQGSMLLRHIDRLLAHPLPPQVSVLETPADAPGRLAAMTQHLRELAASLR